ncbi:MAG: hypothetical protein HUJ78_01895 [Mogibacterium sp.]|nr:hypothetical protein [Mogibacterium sp.]
MKKKGYELLGRSPLGKVYYQPERVVIEGDVQVNYMVLPWISHFEVEGLKADKEYVRICEEKEAALAASQLAAVETTGELIN